VGFVLERVVQFYIFRIKINAGKHVDYTVKSICVFCSRTKLEKLKWLLICNIFSSYGVCL